MAVTYSEAKAVQKIAEELIPQYHQDLNGVRIEYVFRSEAAKSGGKTVFGKARKISGLNAFLASGAVEMDEDDGESFFVIEIAADVWAVLDAKQRTALVDHELAHCQVAVKTDKSGDETVALRLVAHDLEEFNSVVARHGLWRLDVERFITSATTGSVPSLFDDQAS